MEVDAERVLKNTGFLFAGVIIANIISFAFRVLVAREFGSSGFGVLSLGLMVGSISSTIVLFGLADGLINFVGKFRANKQFERIVGISISSLLLSVSLAILLSAFIIASTPFLALEIFDSHELIRLLPWLMLFIPAKVIVDITSSITIGFEYGEYKVFIKQVAPRLFLLLFSALVIYFGGDIADIGRAYSAAMWAAAVLGVFLVIKILPTHSYTFKRADNSSLIRFSAPLMFASAVGFLLNWTDTAIVGYLLDDSAVGVYQSAFLLGANIVIVKNAAAGSLYPNFSSLIESGELSKINHYYMIGRRWAVILTLAPATYLFAFSTESLTYIFGREFAGGGTALSMLVLGQFVSVTFGPVTNLLKSLNQSRFIFMTYFAGGILNLIVNWLLIPEIGIAGAAAGSAVSIALVQASHYLKVRQEISLPVFDYRFVGALTGAVISVTVSATIIELVESVSLFLVHIVIFSSVYLISTMLSGSIKKREIRTVLKYVRST
jgi:O-antigen/teichoic acid export membrane protein